MNFGQTEIVDNFIRAYFRQMKKIKNLSKKTVRFLTLEV